MTRGKASGRAEGGVGRGLIAVYSGMTRFALTWSPNGAGAPRVVAERHEGPIRYPRARAALAPGDPLDGFEEASVPHNGRWRLRPHTKDAVNVGRAPDPRSAASTAVC